MYFFRRRQNFTQIACFVLSFFLLTFLAGCGGEKPDVKAEITMPEPVAPVSEEITETVVDVYWDATYSMQGYTTILTGNFYRTLPDDIGALGESLGEVHFFKFGEDVTPMSGREHRSFNNAQTYTEVITAFNRVIDVANPDHLSIVITDLFESDADWSNVTKKLKEKYFSKHLGVAVIGVKNPFQGDIFDVGIDAAKFWYDSGADVKKYRPFYLFIMGPEKKIEAFIDKWRESETLEGMEYVVFSENFSKNAADFSKMNVLASENIFADERLGIKDKRMKEFGIDSMDSPASIKTSFRYEPTFGACKVSIKNVSTYVEVYYLDGEEGWKVREEDNDILCEFAESADEKDTYDVEIKFTPALSLVPGKINLIHVALAPTSKGIVLPGWIRDWNMASYDIAPNAFDGSKTVNLLHVVGSLKDSMLMVARPSLVNINLVMEAR
ncbi:MAG: hypothetical protein IJT82_00760 [Schwartzia sp.]|nr:hypothetical protein [Schwartzia sp. (in: firmicutes)]